LKFEVWRFSGRCANANAKHQTLNAKLQTIVLLLIPSLTKRLLLRLVLILCVAISPACSDSTPAQKRRGSAGPLAVTVAEAREIPWERSIALVGTLLPAQEARIAAEVEGSIEKTLVEVGDHVAKGAPLAQVDTVSYQGMVNLQTANHNKAIANAENQRENLERLQRLRKSGSVSPTDFDQAVAAEKQAAAEVAATKAQLGSASTALRRSLSIAPFAGAITERLINAGDFARVGTVMFHLVDDSVLRFRGDVPEREAARVKTCQTVRLSVDAWPDRTFAGTVSWINPAVNPNTRGVAIEARVDNARRELKAHFFARAEVVVDAAAPALVVPVEAIVIFAGVTRVFVVEGDTAQSREVVLGATRAGQQEIRAGLKPGERVVVSGRTKVQPGMKVAIEAAPPEAQP
jgi:RND family efflux transporter MFP subunit